MCIQELKVFLQDFVFSNSNDESNFQEKKIHCALLYNEKNGAFTLLRKR